MRDGKPPFTWFVDGVPVARDALTRQSKVRLDEPGFIDILVLDAAGGAARSSVFVE